jgi:hypothetical protein
MVTIAAFRKMALAFPEAEEKEHHGIPSFRVGGKIFATLWEKDKKAMLRLPLIEQSVFCDYDEAIFYPVPGGWGKQGATFVTLAKVKTTMFKDALTVAYCGIAPKRLASMFSGATDGE